MFYPISKAIYVSFGNFLIFISPTYLEWIFVATAILDAAVSCEIVGFLQSHVNALIYKCIEVFAILDCVWEVYEIKGELKGHDDMT